MTANGARRVPMDGARRRCIAAVVLAALPFAAAANTLTLDRISVAALIDALAIEADDAPERTRSMRARKGGGTRAPARAVGRSNLLITFQADTAELTAESRRALATVARALQSERLAAYAFVIEGHADPRGDAERNQRLSEQRAGAVRAQLVSLGVAGDRLEAIGRGASDPLDVARPEAPENRRVTIVARSP